MTAKPKLLDLCCCAGGASQGYADAGFDVTGVDITPQRHYPYPFHLADALTFPLTGFDAVHISPPCQRYSKTQRIMSNDHPDLIAPLRERVLDAGIPYVIENVPGSPLIDPVTLCGAMFHPELWVYRHREFEASFPLTVPDEPAHIWPQCKMGRWPIEEREFIQPVGNFSNVAYARTAMGIDWMTRDELREAIPPAYTRHVGKQLLERV